MSTRILTLLTTTAATLTLAGGLTAALAAPPPAPVPSGAAPAASASPSASPSTSSSAAASPGKNDAVLEKCRDADCTVEITDGQEITLDKRFEMAPIKVKVDGTRVTFAVRSHQSQAIASVNAAQPNTSVSFNDITLRPHMTKDGKVMLTVSHN